MQPLKMQEDPRFNPILLICRDIQRSKMRSWVKWHVFCRARRRIMDMSSSCCDQEYEGNPSETGHSPAELPGGGLQEGEQE